MNTVAAMGVATGLTVARQLSRPDELRARNVSRVILGGVFATAGLLTLGTRYPEIAGGLATVVMLTAVMVHGVPLSEALVKVLA